MESDTRVNYKWNRRHAGWDANPRGLSPKDTMQSLFNFVEPQYEEELVGWCGTVMGDSDGGRCTATDIFTRFRHRAFALLKCPAIVANTRTIQQHRDFGKTPWPERSLALHLRKHG